MKHLYFILICFCIFKVSAQSDITKNLNKNSFEEFGVSKDSILKDFKLPQAEKPVNGKDQKELNRFQLEKFNKKDSLSKIATKDSINLVDSISSKQDTSSILLHQIDSTISSTDSIKIQSIPTINEDTKIDSIKTEINILPKQENRLEETIHYTKLYENTEVIKTIDDEVKKQDSSIIEPPKKLIEDKNTTIDEFSTSPILPNDNKKPTEIITNPASTIQTITDSLEKKPLKDFYFETEPIVIKNGKTVSIEKAPQAEIKKVEEKPITYTPEQLELQKKQEKYNQYQREADSIRYKNQKMLDSLLATLNVKVPVEVRAKDYIEIYVSGGGLYGGMNPKQYDRLMIYQNGLVQREYKSKLGGVQNYETKITKEELTKLAQYIVDMGYYDFEDEYVCDKDDVACKQRMQQNPSPIPLKISVSIGVRRKNIDIDFYAPKLEKKWIDYPNNLEKILNAIYSVTEK